MLNNTPVPFDNKESLLIALRAKLNDLFEKNGIIFSFLYGSWAKNTANWWSDVDIAVYLEDKDYKDLTNKQQFEKLVSLNVQVETLTGLEEIDVKILQNLPLHIQFDIFKHGEIFFDKEPQKRMNYLESLLPKYYDHIIWYKQMLNDSFK